MFTVKAKTPGHFGPGAQFRFSTNPTGAQPVVTATPGEVPICPTLSHISSQTRK